MTLATAIQTVKEEIGWGINEQAAAKDYRYYFNHSIKRGKSESEAHETAMFFITFYIHQYRSTVSI